MFICIYPATHEYVCIDAHVFNRKMNKLNEQNILIEQTIVQTHRFIICMIANLYYMTY